LRGDPRASGGTAGTLDDQVLSRCLEIRVDESPPQTQRIVEAQLRLRSDPGCAERREKVILRHQAAQRMLQAKAVLIPFAARIEFCGSRVSHRRLLDKFLNLVAASALLHQFQRPQDAGMIVASERDFSIAADLLTDVIGRASDELSAAARDVLELVLAESLSVFSMDDLTIKRPDWTRHKTRGALDELLGLEVIASPKRSRPRRYDVVASAVASLAAPAVRLLPVGAIVDSVQNSMSARRSISASRATG